MEDEALPVFSPEECILKACEPLHPFAGFWHARCVSIWHAALPSAHEPGVGMSAQHHTLSCQCRLAHPVFCIQRCALEHASITVCQYSQMQILRKTQKAAVGLEHLQSMLWRQNGS